MFTIGNVMKYGLNDNTVKRIAAVAHHTDGSAINKISNIYGTLTHHETISKIAMAHMSHAMQHRFKDKDEENTFKRHLAIASAINRGTLEAKSHKGEGSEPKLGE